MKYKKSRSARALWIISGGIAVVVLTVGIVVTKILLTDDGVQRKRQIQTVTLLPPPPPKTKEEIPVPETKAEENIQMEEALPEEADDSSENDAPEGEELGLDADGVAGSDAFGLKANKGGRALVGSGTGGSGNQFAWYTSKVRHEIEKKVNEILRKDGGVPDGDLQTLIRVVLDDTGNVVDHAIIKTSGNPKVDEAVTSALSRASISEPPPYGMTKSMHFRIMS